MPGLTAEAYHGVFLDKIVKKVTETIPLFGIIQDKIKISDADRIGEKFCIPTVLALEQGATYARSNSGSFTLEPALDGKVEQMIINGSQIALRSKVSSEAIVSSLNQDQAIEQVMTRVSKLNAISHRKRLEISLIHGQMPKAIVESVAAPAVTFTAASWAPAMWAGMKGAKMEFFAPDYSAKRDVGAPDYPSIVSVDTDARTITFDNAANVVAGDVLQFKGAVIENANPALVVWHEMAGLRKILSTTTGSPFGLDIASYDVLKPNYYSGGAVYANYKLLLRGRTKCLDHGGEDPEYVAFMHGFQFEQLMADEDARRMYDSSYSSSQAKAGSNKLRFAAVGEGTIEPIAHPYWLPSEIALFSWGDLRRPGAQEFSFNLNGGKDEARWSPEGRYIIDLQDAMGHQIRSYSHGCLIHEVPSQAALIYGLLST